MIGGRQEGDLVDAGGFERVDARDDVFRRADDATRLDRFRGDEAPFFTDRENLSQSFNDKLLYFE